MVDSCKIRLLSIDDLAIVLCWRNHPDVRRFMFTQHEIGLVEHRQWFERVGQDTSRRLLIIEEAQAPIGYVQFTGVFDGGEADWGFFVGPNAASGTGRKVGKAALTYAFDALNLNKVCGQVMETNSASIAFHKRLGFKQETSLKDQKNINGEHYPIIYFGLLAQEWRSQTILQRN